MLENQKHLFNLPENPIYLNNAYMGPQLKSVEQIGIENLKRKSRPFEITAADFFTEKEVLRSHFAELIHADDPKSIAIIPSVSYGIANALANIPFDEGDGIVVLEEQFPSNFYAWKALEEDKGVVIHTIAAPPIAAGRGRRWNDLILEAIQRTTKVVALPHAHWADGTRFDLEKIREKTDEVGAYLIIDGTQSVGVLPFSVEKIRPDALICGGYKWLLGPYSLGVAYYGERFYEGTPIENNWMNHVGSEDFRNLVNYNYAMKPKAVRYDVGESSNFILTPMLIEGIRQLLEWQPERIQEYCKSISEGPLQQLQDAGYFVEDAAYRTHHLFGIYLPDVSQMEALQQIIQEAGIFVSYRGNAVRVSCHLYNTQSELEKLVSCFI
ncbi:aminotransferase class V-fold PLP-dependent enzyme [Aureisphaera galaxeae]|uniref:aminotransferase class V-fold PLP-dependent enzyme n=1 Tax=Aureisphaera galaxeae TaxID=1538023 RepID=UPI00235003D2|nr:aminotransferase class V-fold PLP-dependent enzyme [Aureisphaera galaxeae]MDC8006016.1 aminotransferase class V-fold PLP-dependent enzyme [Aureisphaera galaxeae]